MLNKTFNFKDALAHLTEIDKTEVKFDNVTFINPLVINQLHDEMTKLRNENSELNSRDLEFNSIPSSAYATTTNIIWNNDGGITSNPVSLNSVLNDDILESQFLRVTKKQYSELTDKIKKLEKENKELYKKLKGLNIMEGCI